MTIQRPPLHENFALPTREELLEVKMGDSVKLIFPPGERMWVVVEEMKTEHEWKGKLINRPIATDELEWGDKIEFHPLDIIQIQEQEVK